MRRLNTLNKCASIALVVFLSACQNVPRTIPGQPTEGDGSYQPIVPAPVTRDSGPKTPLDVDHIPNAFPVREPFMALGNKSPYEVYGKNYTIIKNIEGFEQVGDASWYGQKFHGQRTSNGEIYNMYGMTAAHKTLPIPCFVELTNLANGKKIIVRVNDRGPFHSDRMIDLSYTAARKLGYAEIGTARLKLKVIMPQAGARYAGLKEPVMPASNGRALAPMPRNPGGYEIPNKTFLQLGAFGDIERAKAFQAQTDGLSSYPVSILHVPNRNVYRVLLGPLKDNWDLVTTQLAVEAKGYNPKVVYY
jgi:rare lipoprotein A